MYAEDIWKVGSKQIHFCQHGTMWAQLRFTKKVGMPPKVLAQLQCGSLTPAPHNRLLLVGKHKTGHGVGGEGMFQRGS